MDGSLRASKRRKLNTPARVASSPLAKASGPRKSGRLVSQPVSHTTQRTWSVEGQGTVSKRTGRRGNGIVQGAGRPRKHDEDKDVWNDIEGALGESPLKTKPQTIRSARKGDTESINNDTHQPHSTKGTLEQRGRKGAVGKEGVGHKSFRSLVEPFRHGPELEANIQDELATASTPTKLTPGNTTRRSVRMQRRKPNDAGTPSHVLLKKPTSARRRATPTVGDELPFCTTSRRTARKPRFEEPSTISETNDELSQSEVPSTSKSVRTRRWANRADNTNNRDDEVVRVSDDGGLNARADIDSDATSVDGNSIVGSVLDPTEPSPFNKPSSAQKEAPALPSLKGHLEPGRELSLLKTIVLGRITGKRPAPLVDVDEEYRSVYQLIEQTVTAGEGNSMLLIGARGSGKTSLVNKVFSEVSKDNSEDYHVVRLNGLIHTDDKVALREIWRQLGKEMDLDEDSGGVGKNYADTLTTLLALLSHPSEQTGEVTDQIAKAVIFVMDEFDLFAQHPRQTLLYNLFDVAQSRKAPIAVLGLTTRIDVANSLEKRVKSRFSHRYVHLSLAKTFTAFQEMCKANLSVQPEHLSIEERSILGAAVGTPAKKNGKIDVKEDALLAWNSHIDVCMHCIFDQIHC
jgi:origin recognition complex subunit 4